MTTKLPWPSFSYVRRLFAGYAVAAALGGMGFLLVVALIFRPVPTMLFLAGAVAGMAARPLWRARRKVAAYIFPQQHTA
jgi:hypothetical protein